MEQCGDLLGGWLVAHRHGMLPGATTWLFVLVFLSRYLALVSDSHAASRSPCQARPSLPAMHAQFGRRSL